jgi:hypothetical protein
MKNLIIILFVTIPFFIFSQGGRDIRIAAKIAAPNTLLVDSSCQIESFLFLNDEPISKVIYNFMPSVVSMDYTFEFKVSTFDLIYAKGDFMLHVFMTKNGKRILYGKAPLFNLLSISEKIKVPINLQAINQAFDFTTYQKTNYEILPTVIYQKDNKIFASKLLRNKKAEECPTTLVADGELYYVTGAGSVFYSGGYTPSDIPSINAENLNWGVPKTGSIYEVSPSPNEAYFVIFTSWSLPYLADKNFTNLRLIPHIDREKNECIWSPDGTKFIIYSYYNTIVR